MAGFLLAYVVLDEAKKKCFRFQTPAGAAMAIIHRLLRIWPCYIIAILVFWKLSIYFGKGPYWNAYDQSIAGYCIIVIILPKLLIITDVMKIGGEIYCLLITLVTMQLSVSDGDGIKLN